MCRQSVLQQLHLPLNKLSVRPFADLVDGGLSSAVQRMWGLQIPPPSAT